MSYYVCELNHKPKVGTSSSMVREQITWLIVTGHTKHTRLFDAMQLLIKDDDN